MKGNDTAMRLIKTYYKRQCIKATHGVAADARTAYYWIMQAPWTHRPLRLWCVKHSHGDYKSLYDWLSAPD